MSRATWHASSSRCPWTGPLDMARVLSRSAWTGKLGANPSVARACLVWTALVDQAVSAISKRLFFPNDLPNTTTNVRVSGKVPRPSASIPVKDPRKSHSLVNDRQQNQLTSLFPVSTRRLSWNLMARFLASGHEANHSPTVMTACINSFGCAVVSNVSRCSSGHWGWNLVK